MNPASRGPHASPAGRPDIHKVRLAYVVSHPIQYQAPLLRRIAQEPDIDLTVLFGSDLSLRGYKDEGFGVEVHWDTPLLEGYRSAFLPSLALPGRPPTAPISAFNPLSRGIHRHLRTASGAPAFDAVWVHGYASINALHTILAANLLGIPILLRAESWLADRPRSPLKLALKSAFLRALRPFLAATLPIGTENALYWQHYFGPDFPQFLVPYAVDNAWFAARADAARSTLPDLRAELNLEPHRPVILFASKLQQRKHCDHLLDAYQRLLAQLPDGAPQPYLLIVGDGEQRASLEARVRDQNLTGVRFTGFQNQTALPRFFALSDVFVLPSRHEPWGLIVNEVMASGCAVIASSDVGCAADLLVAPSDHNAPPGFVYPVGDIAALTAALARVLATPETSAAMGAAASQRIAHWGFEQDLQGLRAALAYTTRKLRP